MQKIKKELVLRKDDYNIILSYLKGSQNKSAFDRRNAEELELELKKARLVSPHKFPADVVGLNSKVKIKEENKGNVMELMLVTPDMADIKEKKVSVMAPIGAALIGFRKGQSVNWKMPAGEKTFTILEVENHTG
ncbi:MAG TPA: nucleoside diphosphate kinase regulator [Flavitalea sp.]|nr:nucleoside diphosphate kinase regulator [Flavitalea sp.]